MKKKHRKIIVRTLVTLIPAVILAGTLTYVKLFGFKRALEELVDSRTNGEYSLTIKRSFVNPITMSFTFDGLTIKRNTTSSVRGIREVTIPVLKLRFGSMKSMLMVKQFNIKNLTIEEPVIEFDRAPADDIASLRSPRSNANLAQQLVKLYPAIEALLSNFNIESLLVQRASVGMEKKIVNSAVRLNFIDLLIEHWNIQHLTDESQLQLKVGGQHLEFAKVSLLFSGVEFNFQQHQLRFNDFKFYSLDSTSQSRIEAHGKLLLLEGLNYKELYEKQRYAIRKAVIEKPNVNLWINLSKKDSAKVKDKDLVTRILRQSFGEFSIDSTIIRNASVHTVFHHGSDSVKIDLPQLDLKLRGFSVVRDSSKFQMGELEIGLNRTAISLRKNLSLHCDRIMFDKNRNLTFTDVVMYDSTRGKEIATIGKLSLNYFNLVYFIFYQRFFADNVNVENAVIHLTPEHLKDKSNARGPSKIENLDVQHIAFENVAINYIDKDNQVLIRGLSANVNNLKQSASGEFKYDFKTIQFRRATIKHAPEHLEAQLNVVRFDGKNITADEIHLQKDSLKADAMKWEAQLVGNAFIDRAFQNWNYIKFHDLKILGRISTHVTRRHKDGRKPFTLSVAQVTIEQLLMQASIAKSDLRFSGTNIRVFSAGYSDGAVRYRSLKGYLENIHFQTPNVNSDIESIQVDYPSQLKCKNTVIAAGATNVKFPLLSVYSITKGDDRWMFKKVSVHYASLMKDQLQVSTDSVRVNGVQFLGGNTAPVIDHLEVFNPSVILPKRRAPGSDRSKKKDTSDFDWMNRFTIHPGEITLPNKKVITFGKIEGDHKKNSLFCESVSMETSKINWRLYALRFLQHRIDIDSVSIRPNETWLGNGLEESKITAGIYGLHLTGLSKDELTSGPMDDVDVTVDRFLIDVIRDKRLPEGPYREKPATLAKLLKLPRFLKINNIWLNHGKLHYIEISEKTGESGVVTLEEITAHATLERKGAVTNSVNLEASSKLYNDGTIDLKYETLDSSSFALAVGLKNMNLTKLNQAVIPLLALEIKSGYVKQYNMKVIADNEKAVGNASISYKNLHLEIFKKGVPERRTLGSELITFVTDGIILKNSKENAKAVVDQPRIKNKAIFNYWIRSAMQGAMGAIRKGRSKKTT